MRFSPLLLFDGQKRVLSDYRREKTKPDMVSRFLLLGLPIVAMITVFFCSEGISSVETLIAGTAILAGTLLAAFGQLAAWRDKLTEYAERYPNIDRLSRDSMDETVTHVLAAAYTSGVATILLTVSSVFELREANDDPLYHGVFLALGIGFAAHAALSFLIAVPRLYYAYASMNRVRKELTKAL